MIKFFSITLLLAVTYLSFTSEKKDQSNSTKPTNSTKAYISSAVPPLEADEAYWKAREKQPERNSSFQSRTSPATKNLQVL